MCQPIMKRDVDSLDDLFSKITEEEALELIQELELGTSTGRC